MCCIVMGVRVIELLMLFLVVEGQRGKLILLLVNSDIIQAKIGTICLSVFLEFAREQIVGVKGSL